MSSLTCSMFTSYRSFVIFVVYIILFVSQGLFVIASKSTKHGYAYNITTVVLVTEIFKTAFSLLLYVKDEGAEALLADIKTYRKALLQYFVPAGLYSLYNNLAFINLAEYDPTTYSMLLKFRTVLTGILYQVVFRRKLSRIQWTSLIVLMFGCVVKEINYSSILSKAISFNSIFTVHFLLIILQVFVSCFAGVYNEFLLKDNKAHIMLQNVFLYFDSIVCNGVVLGVRGQLRDCFNIENISTITQTIVLCVIINNTLAGICVSVFLQSMNVIMKSFASAIELIFIALLSWAIFGIPVDLQTAIVIIILISAVVLYSTNPIQELPQESNNNQHTKPDNYIELKM